MTDQNGQQPTHIAVPMPLAQAILDNLQAQPYRDVAALIAEIQKCQTVRLEAKQVETDD